MKKVALILSVLVLLTMMAGCAETSIPEIGNSSSDQATASQGVADAGTVDPSQTTIPVDELITNADAQSIAFEKANVQENDVSRLEVDLNYDDDQQRWEYEVDFQVGLIEYEVDIDAKTGGVVFYAKDDNATSKATTTTNTTEDEVVITTTSALKTTSKATSKVTSKATSKSTSVVTSTTVTTADSKLISKAQAKKIALNKAGVKESEISRYSIKTDYDDDRNRWEYEIDFHVGKVEYDVTVDAVKGTVVGFERDGKETTRKVTTSTKPKFITKDDVKSVALLCAGVNESKISRYEVELDYDDDTKRWEYEVTFNVGRIEYDILINAITGELIHWEKEVDD